MILMRSVVKFSAAVSAKAVVPAPAPIARGTVSSSEDISDAVAPVAVSGVGATAPASSLKPFGYDLFANAPTTYAPAASIPVSGDYLLGPGDTWIFFFTVRQIILSRSRLIERVLLISLSWAPSVWQD